MAGIEKGTVRISGVMIADLDIFRTARLLIEQHGSEAPIHAAMRADAMLEAGDLDGQAVWLRILKAVEGLLDQESPGKRGRAIPIFGGESQATPPGPGIIGASPQAAGSADAYAG